MLVALIGVYHYKSVEQVTLPDLQETIGTLTESILSEIPDKSEDTLSIGEHVIVYWLTTKPEWCLATVDTAHEDILDVIAVQVSVKNKKNEWELPLYPKVYTVDIDQVLKRKVPVGYLQSDKVKCRISDETLYEVEKHFDS